MTDCFTRWKTLWPLLLLSSLLGGCRDSLINGFAFYPARLAADAIVPHGAQELFIHASDGTRLQCLWFYHPDNRNTVLYLHGNAGHLYQRSADARALAAATGSNVLLLSYRGYGKSSGSPSEQGIYQDGTAALEYLLQQRGIAPARLFILGRSLGTAVAVHIARHRPAPGGLILLSPFSSGNDMARSSGLGWLSPILGNPFDSVSKVRQLSLPALFVHGADDQIVPPALGRRLYTAYRGQDKQFRLISGAGHNDLLQVAGAQIWQWAGSLMDRATD